MGKCNREGEGSQLSPSTTEGQLDPSERKLGYAVTPFYRISWPGPRLLTTNSPTPTGYHFRVCMGYIFPYHFSCLDKDRYSNVDGTRGSLGGEIVMCTVCGEGTGGSGQQLHPRTLSCRHILCYSLSCPTGVRGHSS